MQCDSADHCFKEGVNIMNRVLAKAGTLGTLDLTTPLFSLRVDERQFRCISDPSVQRELFSSYVKRIVLETSAYCNRRCRFCPNADGGRLERGLHMPAESFLAIIDDLASIDYSGTILFHLYNEPLANPDIFEQIAFARLKLPTANLSFNSNGDYIRPGTLKRLALAGLSKLHISIYGPEHGLFDHDYVMDRVRNMAKLCSLPEISAKWISELECRAIGTFTEGDVKLPLIIQAKNFNTTGFDRGGLVNTNELQTEARQYPCPSPFDELLINWNGAVVPCCNIVGDRPEHKSYVVGEALGPGDIFAIYANGPLVAWRRSLMRFGQQSGPCAGCTRLSAPIPQLTEVHEAFNAEVTTIIQAAEVAEESSPT
jgi:hypothetical protein